MSLDCALCFLGLTLHLKVPSGDELPWVSVTGLKVFVHAQSEVPGPETPGFFLSPGHETNLGLIYVSVS